MVMEKHSLYTLVRKLRPELDKLSGLIQLQAFVQVLMVLYLTPFALITIIWLSMVAQPIDIQRSWLPITLLFIGFLITNNQTAVLLIEVEPQKNLTSTSSLGVILLWVGLFLFGPVMIWFSILADGITNLIDAE